MLVVVHENLMFHNQNNGTKCLLDNRALFAAENGDLSRTRTTTKYENEAKRRNLRLSLGYSEADAQECFFIRE